MRTFLGHRYDGVGWHSTKEGADKQAAKERKRGSKVRVAKSYYFGKLGWECYVKVGK